MSTLDEPLPVPTDYEEQLICLSEDFAPTQADIGKYYEVDFTADLNDLFTQLNWNEDDPSNGIFWLAGVDSPVFRLEGITETHFIFSLPLYTGEFGKDFGKYSVLVPPVKRADNPNFYVQYTPGVFHQTVEEFYGEEYNG